MPTRVRSMVSGHVTAAYHRAKLGFNPSNQYVVWRWGWGAGWGGVGCFTARCQGLHNVSSRRHKRPPTQTGSPSLIMNGCSSCLSKREKQSKSEIMQTQSPMSPCTSPFKGRPILSLHIASSAPRIGALGHNGSAGDASIGPRSTAARRTRFLSRVGAHLLGAEAGAAGRRGAGGREVRFLCERTGGAGGGRRRESRLPAQCVNACTARPFIHAACNRV